MTLDRKLRLLDLNVMWPPDSQPFITGRLRALSASGVQVTVTSACAGHMESSLMSFARVLRLPSSNESRSEVLVRTLRQTLLLLIQNPGKLTSLVKVARSRVKSLRSLPRWWADSVPLVGERPDIIHFEWNSLASHYDWLPDYHKVPFVVSCRGRQVNIVPFLPGHEESIRQLKDSFQKATLVHGVCEDILRKAELNGLTPAKGRVVYTAVDHSFFHPAENRNSPPGAPVRLLNVGVSMWRKGYEYLLQAVRAAIDSGVRLSLEVADYDGPERERAEFTIRELGLEDCVKILGKLNPPEVRDALWRCDIFVLSALSEGVSNAAVEAMACGIPVVTTDCGGMNEAVTDGVEGLVVPRRDAQLMAQAICRLAEDASLRSQMGKRGRERVLRQFDQTAQARAFTSLYEEAMDLFHSPADTGSVNNTWKGIGNGRNLTTHASTSKTHRDHAFHIVTVADLHWRNGHEYALEAIALLARKGLRIRYTIVGTGPFLEAVGFARYELGLMEIAEIIQDVSVGESVIDSADLFLLAAVDGGAGHSLERAKSLRIPSICTDAPALGPVLSGFEECVVVPRRDKNAIADAILKVVGQVDAAAVIATDTRQPSQV